MFKKQTKKIVLLLMLLNLFLNIYGNNWGLPARWHSDEKVAEVLHMADQRTLISPFGFFLHPTGYHIFLLIAFVPVYLFLRLTNYPLAALKQAASVSWTQMGTQFPEFTAGIYIYARSLSAILGALTIYLIYRLTTELYDEKAGIFSAASLSLCMGFVAVNHFAKNISLICFLIVLTLLSCVMALGKEIAKKNAQRFIFLAFFLAGLAGSVHIYTPIVLLPLFLTFIFARVKFANRFKAAFSMLTGCIFLYIAGVIVGTPSLLTNFRDYFAMFAMKYQGGLELSSAGALSIFIRPINYLFELISIYGIPQFVLILLGLTSSIVCWKKISKQEVVIFSFIASFFLIITGLLKDKYPQIEHIIAIVPFLSIFAGRAMSIMFKSTRLPTYLKYGLISLVFFYSLAYSFKADLFFVTGDTRYHSTAWIYEHAPLDSKIEVLDQLNYVASDSIMKDYEIIYLGRSSREFKGKRFFKWNTVAGRQDYLRQINRGDSASDYIIVDLNDLDNFLSSPGEGHTPGLSEYLRALFNNKKNYRLVKTFSPINQKIKKDSGLIHFKNLWWDPVPCYRVTANAIHIFERLK